MTTGVLGVAGGGLHGVLFYGVISIENLFDAWNEFKRGKCSKKDVATFELQLEDNLFNLHNELKADTWKPHQYTQFYVTDPKLRSIHKASVRDRVLYQAIYRKLYPIFDPMFIYDSYASRNGKGVHRGVLRAEFFMRKASKNYSRQCWILKCDIRKFFDSIDQQILYKFILKKITDEKLLALIARTLKSFETKPDKGLPLGNVTSQLFANIYLNELDQFAKHVLKAKYYIRYCDDFVIIDNSEAYVRGCIQKLSTFCREKLLLDLHPRKVFIRKGTQGVDFLGYVLLRGYKILRPKTKKRILNKIKEITQSSNSSNERYKEAVVQSYFGVLSHGRSEKTYKIIAKLLNSQRG